MEEKRKLEICSAFLNHSGLGDVLWHVSAARYDDSVCLALRVLTYTTHVSSASFSALTVKMSGGYEVERFVDSPDHDLICVICRAVLRCPVRLPCNHVFCKECILLWMKRQVKCPCCRKSIDQNQMLVLCKLSKSIGRLTIKCRNQQQGCTAAFPLSNEYFHISNCPYEWQLCPHEGCGEQVLRKDAQAHDQSCSHWRQPCPMGCGTLLFRENRTQHNCYRELHQRYVAERRKQRTVATNLRRKMMRMQSRMAQIKRQINLLCESLEVGDLESEVGQGTSTNMSHVQQSNDGRHCHSSRVRSA